MNALGGTTPTHTTMCRRHDPAVITTQDPILLLGWIPCWPVGGWQLPGGHDHEAQAIARPVVKSSLRISSRVLVALTLEAAAMYANIHRFASTDWYRPGESQDW